MFIHLFGERIKFKPIPYRLYKISKWIKDLYFILETLKILEENIGEKLHDFMLGSDFSQMTQRQSQQKQK